MPETVRVNVPTPAAATPEPRQLSSRSESQKRPAQQATPTPAPVTPPPVAAPVATGSGLILVSVPGCSSAEIFIDGARIGSGRGSKTVSAGVAHTVRVTAEGATPFSQSVTVDPNGRQGVVASGVTCSS